ncbi:MAG: HisA/HisF-related TIM barrel protein [Thermaerobacter sp.]
MPGNAEDGFEILAAVDILGGRCVRLHQGDYGRPTDYGDPLERARAWAEEGARWLHVVDLDGARGGVPAALDAAARIRSETGCRVQYGGGIRGPEALAAALAAADRAVVSSWALREPEAVCRELARYPGRVLVSLDVRDGRVWIDGWRTGLAVPAAQAARDFVAAGAAGVVVTGIARDGTLEGVDREVLQEAASWGVPFWWAGGVASAADAALVRHVGGRWVRGLIAGRALYEGRVTISDLKQAAAGVRDRC